MKKGALDMSWIKRLYETYNNSQRMIGTGTDENEVPLLPICHTTQKAQIEIVLDNKGNFRRASVIPKNEARTIIPCTEDSGGRTSGEAAHPLCDKLQYVAVDYSTHGGTKKPYFASYISQLEKWCDSEFSDEKTTAVLKYIKKGMVIEDLVIHNILIVDNKGKLIPKWEKKKGETVPEIFEVLDAQDDAFIRWEVEIPGKSETKVWKDKNLWSKWIHYYSGTKEQTSLCYVTGENKFVADQHPAKIRNDGDKAKLISSNDWEGFTFRGRFTDKKDSNNYQTCSVGFDVTQKAHFALRWLVNRQGYRKGDLAIVAWATSGAPIPRPTDDPLAILEVDDLPTDEITNISTAQDIAIKLKKKIAGYGKEIGDTTDIVVMGLDSATPGRMAIIYYRELTGSDFLQRIEHWHESCAWLHKYGEIRNEESGKVKKNIPFIGAPAPSDIAEATYGSRLDDKLRKATITRILPCIIDGQPIPPDLVESVVRRASNRIGIKNPDDKRYYGDEEYTWKKTLSIACSLFKKHNRKEKYTMALDPQRKTRDYLYGRLLALADSLEAWALSEANENRQTNATRLMQRFAERPYTTWRTIELALTPSKARLGGKSKKRQQIIDEVIASFEPKDFMSDKRLSGEFLLGYHSQRELLRPSRTQEENSEIDSINQ
jgi:CRISPR-associated protein Csd1